MNAFLENYIYSKLNNLKENLNLAIIYAGDKEKENSVFFKRKNTRHWKSYEKVAKDIKDSLSTSGFKNIFINKSQENSSLYLGW